MDIILMNESDDPLYKYNKTAITIDIIVLLMIFFIDSILHQICKKVISDNKLVSQRYIIT